MEPVKPQEKAVDGLLGVSTMAALQSCAPDGYMGQWANFRHYVATTDCQM